MLTKIQSALATDISSETTKLADAIVGLGGAFPSISSFASLTIASTANVAISAYMTLVISPSPAPASRAHTPSCLSPSSIPPLSTTTSNYITPSHTLPA